jgi:sensor domain CHASE-containing protein
MHGDSSFHDPDQPDLVARLQRWADIYAHVNVSDELLEAAGEIARLEQWKREAKAVIEEWEGVFAIAVEASDVVPVLGGSKASTVAAELLRLRGAL